MDDQHVPATSPGTDPEDPPAESPRSTGTSPLVVVIIVFAVLGFAGLSCAGLAAAIAVPNYMTMKHRAMRAEVPSNINGIKTAQLAHDAAFDAFVPAGVWPRAVELLDEQPQPWSPGSAYEALGWAPDGQVRGTYQVEVLPGGRDFIVHGWIDADGDGVPAHFTARKSVGAQMETPDNVY